MEGTLLGQGYGYGFALGLGAAFALLMVLITIFLAKYLGQVQDSERFSVGLRSISSGLISSATVLLWVWPATLLTSGLWSYNSGIMGGLQYGIGGTVQITLFLFLAIQIKRNASSAHTLSECFSVRFGKTGHITFLFYCMSTNILISACLLLGGSQGFAATTGMHVAAASFLLPINVVIYTTMGGLKATFVSDWTHTVIIYGILLATCYRVFCTSPLIGSPGKMYDLLKEVQETFPSATGQSYLSFHDRSMFFLTWSVALGGLSSVFGDPGYSQRAIASNATDVFHGYLMGGICWWVVPFAIGTSAGLACRALLNNPVSITYPDALTPYEAEAGLPVIYGMAAVFGKSGAAAGLVMLFMSVTSATSAELIAFSSVTTYDIYRTYFKPEATGKQLVNVGHLAVIGFGIFMAALSTVLNYVGVTVGWLLSFLGIVLNPEVSAVCFTLFWPKMTKYSVAIGCPLATLTGLACWIGSTYHFAGAINKDTLMTTEATFIGNIVSLSSGAIYIMIISYIKPDPVTFDMSTLNSGFKLGDDVDKEGREAVILTEANKRTLKIQSWSSLGINLFIVIGVYVIICVALYATKRDLSKSSFTGLIIVMMIWLLLAAAYIILFPLWQGRDSIISIIKHLLGKVDSLEKIEASRDSASDNISVEAVEEPHVMKV